VCEFHHFHNNGKWEETEREVCYVLFEERRWKNGNNGTRLYREPSNKIECICMGPILFCGTLSMEQSLLFVIFVTFIIMDLFNNIITY